MRQVGARIHASIVLRLVHRASKCSTWNTATDSQARSSNMAAIDRSTWNIMVEFERGAHSILALNAR